MKIITGEGTNNFIIEYNEEGVKEAITAEESAISAQQN